MEEKKKKEEEEKEEGGNEGTQVKAEGKKEDSD